MMNKITKGALATGLGVALLLGGGGTLAVWNTQTEGEQNTIKNGDMTLTAGVGTWTNAKGTVITNPADYRAVPGDVLTFTQKVNVFLEGDLMQARLTVNKNLAAGTASLLTVGTPKLMKDDETKAVVTDPLTPATDGDFVASVDVTFPSTTDDTDGAKASNELGSIGFLLNQDAIATQP